MIDHTRLACYALIASAFVLAGLLAVSLGRMEPTADAELVIARDNFTLMTAQTRSGVESLFVLDNQSGRLYIYDLDRNRELIPGAVTELGPAFDRMNAGAPGGGGRGTGR